MNSTVEILIAEDEEHIAKLVAFKLSREGYAVTVACDGGEAVARLPERPWSLVILDVMMPVHDGWHVLKTLRASAQPDIPVLMLTAKSYQKDVANAAELGATHFLKKPFDPNELALMVRKIVGAS
ncbi:MAG: response regulator transcription factor [Bdellovibrionota bacterium]